jgi:hypothetical protein
MRRKELRYELASIAVAQEFQHFGLASRSKIRSRYYGGITMRPSILCLTPSRLFLALRMALPHSTSYVATVTGGSLQVILHMTRRGLKSPAQSPPSGCGFWVDGHETEKLWWTDKLILAAGPIPNHSNIMHSSHTRVPLQGCWQRTQALFPLLLNHSNKQSEWKQFRQVLHSILGSL